jgi:transcriptional regulator with XRE-family HTH domain
VTDQERFGVNVRERRTRLGLSQRALHDATGISPPKISLIENGRGNPTLRTMLVLAIGLKTTVQKLTRGV